MLTETATAVVASVSRRNSPQLKGYSRTFIHCDSCNRATKTAILLINGGVMGKCLSCGNEKSITEWVELGNEVLVKQE